MKLLDSNVPGIGNTPDILVVENIVARHFPRTHPTYTERVKEGVSTYVYRIHYANEIFYLRILPEIDASFAPEVTVHQLLRAKQVKVPDVLYSEHMNEELGRSIMLTSEIKGKPLGQCSIEWNQRAILQEAGRDLAIINSLPVRYFGWIRRDSQEITALEATLPTNRDFIYEYLEHDLATLAKKVLTSNQVATIRQLVQRFDDWINDGTQAWLAHGDFDATHIYHDQGRYTGIIDFGEIRGTHSLYDLAHFRLHDGETLPNLVLPFLITGYREVTPLPPDYEQRVSFFSLLIATRTLARALEKRPDTVYNPPGSRIASTRCRAFACMRLRYASHPAAVTPLRKCGESHPRSHGS